MQISTNLGGDRLGSGNDQKLHMRNYEMSSHDLTETMRTTMAAGTLVPFLCKVALPGDDFDIKLACDVVTHPTIGPLFSSYKIQMDVFSVPIRLYQGRLHMNELEIGNKMREVLLPQLKLSANSPKITDDVSNSQINPSCLLKYLGISGLGYLDNPASATDVVVQRYFNAIPTLAYWDIFKNYYANKQEDDAFVIHNDLNIKNPLITAVDLTENTGEHEINPLADEIPTTGLYMNSEVEPSIVIECDLADYFDPERFIIYTSNDQQFKGTEMFQNWERDEDSDLWHGSGFLNPTLVDHNGNYTSGIAPGAIFGYKGYEYDFQVRVFANTEPKLQSFPLKNIDEMRKEILRHDNDAVPFEINDSSLTPYSYLFKNLSSAPGNTIYSKQSGQEGLALKTYQSDLFNNWVSTEWIDGDGGINDITKVTVDEDGSFTIDELNIASKIHKMLMRIATAGGSYRDWMLAVYTREPKIAPESPIYMGSLIKELGFQEVISNAATSDQPLGTLAGRGRLTQKHKGGKIDIKVNEPSYIMGIISLTPRIAYSQGNEWDVNLKTMDDFHKPALSQIGYQDLITDQMAWWDTALNNDGTNFNPIFKSAGKQPAWINYQTSTDKIRGNFAIETQQQFMVGDRRYEFQFEGNTGNGTFDIKDLTTYIDPSKFNHQFAYTRLDAQNFWVATKAVITARRKMSAKAIPNL